MNRCCTDFIFFNAEGLRFRFQGLSGCFISRRFIYERSAPNIRDRSLPYCIRLPDRPTNDDWPTNQTTWGFKGKLYLQRDSKQSVICHICMNLYYHTSANCYSWISRTSLSLIVSFGMSSFPLKGNIIVLAWSHKIIFY